MGIFNQTCPIWMEAGSAKKVGEKALEYKATKAFCITDKGISGCGIADIIVDSLKNAGIAVQLYDEVLPDAPDTAINEIANKARAFDTDLVVGIGGGSSLDTAKAVTVLVDNPGEAKDYYIQTGNVYKEVTPLFAIPTAAGTGSEATNICVIHDLTTDVKETIIKSATLAIVDAELTTGLPPHITASTAFDAMAHAMEAYTSNGHNPHSDLLALHAICLITENIEDACEDGSNMDARCALAEASNFAGISFNDASVHVGHAMAHELGIKFHMPHGLACALTLPTLLRYYEKACPERLLDIIDAMGISVPVSADISDAAFVAEEFLKRLMKKLKLSSLKDLGYSLEDVVACAKPAYDKAPFLGATPGGIDVDGIAELLKDMYERYQ